MIAYENECCGCAAPGYPCIGNTCSLFHVMHLYCDRCGCDEDKLYDIGGEQVCKECLLEMFDIIEAE